MNMVNMRREFFRVTLDEIREAVEQNFGEVTFRIVPEAEEFRKTLARQADTAKPVRWPATATAPAHRPATLHPTASPALPEVDLLSLAGKVGPPQVVDERPTVSGTGTSRNGK